MRRMLLALTIATVCAATGVSAQAPGAGERFGIGTFQLEGRTFTGLALRDEFVIDLAAAASAANVQVPTDMLEIIAQYDTGVGDRLKGIVRTVASQLGANRPAYVHDLTAVDTLKPFTPVGVLQARSNYLEHFLEMGGGARDAEVDQNARQETRTQVLSDPPDSIPGYWERAADDRRQNPYLFSVQPTAYVGDGDPIEVPTGREWTDFECEMAAVIGSPARRVSIDQASDYIFGYMIVNDVSDRGPGGGGWLMSKNSPHPSGPWITPKEFVDPLNTPVTFTLSGRVMQNSTSAWAIHNAYELTHFASNIVQLHPGHVIAIGTPSGVGTARTPPIYMQPGDTAVCTYEGLGTLTNPVVAEGPATSTAAR